jgi:hypothetical protein
MEQKKNPTKDLNRKRGLYFVIGLVLLLALLYMALEWKSPFDDGGYDLDEPIEDAQHGNDSTIILKTKATKNDTTFNRP